METSTAIKLDILDKVIKKHNISIICLREVKDKAVLQMIEQRYATDYDISYNVDKPDAVVLTAKQYRGKFVCNKHSSSTYVAQTFHIFFLKKTKGYKCGSVN